MSFGWAWIKYLMEKKKFVKKCHYEMSRRSMVGTAMQIELC